MFTFEDSLAHALDYLGGNPSDLANRECRRAVLAAYRDLATEHNWTYLLSNGRIHLNAAFVNPAYGLSFVKAATVGPPPTVPNLWTLTGGTLPSWTPDGYLRIAEVIYRVDRALSPTTFTTISNLSPDLDTSITPAMVTITNQDGSTSTVPDPSSVGFTLYQDTYELPSDFSAADQLLYQRSFGGMSYVHPSEWLRDNRFTNQVGQCRWYTVTGDQKYQGRLVVRVFPYPGESVSIDFVYRRVSRPLVYASVNDGTLSTTSGESSVVVSGSSSASSLLVGSVVRLSSNVSKYPTGPSGNNPFAYEGIIIDYNPSTNTYVVDQPVPFTVGALKYSISDPIDIEEISMLTAFLRGVEKQVSMQRVMKDKPSANLQYEAALRKAKASDSRSFAGRVVGQESGVYRQRLARMPMSFN